MTKDFCPHINGTCKLVKCLASIRSVYTIEEYYDSVKEIMVKPLTPHINNTYASTMSTYIMPGTNSYQYLDGNVTCTTKDVPMDIYHICCKKIKVEYRCSMISGTIISKTTKIVKADYEKGEYKPSQQLSKTLIKWTSDIESKLEDETIDG